MRKLLMACLGWTLAGAGLASAQSSSPVPAEPQTKPSSVMATDSGVSANDFCCPARGPRIWADTEYLMWWIKSAPLAIPLVSANNDPNSIAALNEAGTVVLFGAGSGRSTAYDPFSGGRVTVGGWLGADRRIGWEGSGFLLEERSLLFGAGSPGGLTAPVVAIPINATQPFGFTPAGETSVNSGNSPNSIFSRVSSRLWGAEANGLFNLLDTSRFQLTALAGFRYLDLIENLSLTESIVDVGTNGLVNVGDAFGTRNQFYGGQIGVRGRLTRGAWSLDTTLKVAFGTNHEVSNIAGATTVTNGAFGFANGMTPGGAFAQPSNIGRISRDVFAVVPEAQFKIAYQMGQYLRPFVGYNFLYLSDALRPGNQMDRNINPTSNFPFFVPPGALTGPPSPVPGFRGSEFWAQGINFGLEIRY